MAFFQGLADFQAQQQPGMVPPGGQASGGAQNPNGSWFDQNAPGGGIGPGANGKVQPGGAVPSYVNMSDPVQAAVWKAYQDKGITPRDQGDFNYWVQNITSSGGLQGGNGQYWLDRMKQPQGGVGDYGQGSGGGGGQGGAQPGGGYGSLMFNAPSLDEARQSPGYQFALQQGMKGIENSAASKGTLLTGGTLKALQGYGTGLADQTYGSVFNRALDVNRTNFGNLYNFANLGVNAAGSAAS